MDQPLISVVLTTHNRSNLLRRAVNSVLEGSYQNFELLIFDDASTDSTPDYAAALTDPRVRYYRFPTNGGVLRSRNLGFDESGGEYITILDDDDELTPDALETIAREFAEDRNTGIGILWFDCVDVESTETSGFIEAPGSELAFMDYVCGRIHGDFWLVFRRETLAGYRFDERLKAHESLLWLKMHRKHRARHVARTLCRKYRRHGGPRLCDIDVRMAQLRETTLAMHQFVETFGPDLLSTCPQVYGGKLAYLGLHQMATGDFASGRASVLRSLRHRFSIKYAGLWFSSFFMGSEILVSVIQRIESGAETVA